MASALEYKNITSRPVQIAANAGGAFAADSLLPSRDPMMRAAAVVAGALAGNFLYNELGLGTADAFLSNPTATLANAVKDVATGNATLGEDLLVGGAAYGGYKGVSYLTAAGEGDAAAAAGAAAAGEGAAGAAAGAEEGAAAAGETGLLEDLGLGGLEAFAGSTFGEVVLGGLAVLLSPFGL